jgi:hypothetical protein
MLGTTIYAPQFHHNKLSLYNHTARLEKLFSISSETTAPATTPLQACYVPGSLSIQWHEQSEPSNFLEVVCIGQTWICQVICLDPARGRSTVASRCIEGWHSLMSMGHTFLSMGTITQIEVRGRQRSDWLLRMIESEWTFGHNGDFTGQHFCTGEPHASFRSAAALSAVVNPSRGPWTAVTKEVLNV